MISTKHAMTLSSIHLKMNPGREDSVLGAIIFRFQPLTKTTAIGSEACLFNKNGWKTAPTSKSMGFEHMNFTCCISKSKKTMVIWLLLGCKRDVHLFSLRISATSVQSCTSICGTGPQCTQCLDWDKWRESRKGPVGGGLKDYSFSPRSLGKWANLTSNFNCLKPPAVVQQSVVSLEEWQFPQNLFLVHHGTMILNLCLVFGGKPKQGIPKVILNPPTLATIFLEQESQFKQEEATI